MKTMKGLSMNRMLGSIKKRATSGGNSNNTGDAGGSSEAAASGTTPAGTPEATAHNNVKAFCESGGNVKGDEVLFLPPIVDAAESSPAAAAECARLIRKYMNKDYISRPSWQYNSIMLLRILTDNPGATFTRNLDQKFVDVAKQLLKGARDQSVRTILMETLDDFENIKVVEDENLTLIVTMWQKEKERAFKDQGGQVPRRGAPTQSQMYAAANVNPHSQNYFARNHSNKRLPDPAELANRLEEARTSAKLLEQVVMNTPPPDFLDNDLIREFADRCTSASRSIQGYMVSEDPTPDNETMEHLIDTNEQLQTALNQHKRAILNARKHMGLGARTDSNSPALVPDINDSERPTQWQNSQASSSGSGAPALPTRPAVGNGKGKDTEMYEPPPGPPPGVGPSGTGASGSVSGTNKFLPEQPREDPFEDPFRDPQPAHSSSRPGPGVQPPGDHEDQRLAYEPYHPGFKPTESYMGRQDSAVGKVQMHGGGTSSVSETTNSPHRTRVDEVSDDDDIYEASPRTKEPMYRY
ncbi:Fc.00g035830.m01.CDS01 [Cosmosporella sp. VM-42]